MRKQTIETLTRKGFSQKKIALMLHIRKTKVVAEQKRLKIGKRSPFWRDVKTIREMKGVSHAKAIKEVKFSKKWFERRQRRLTGATKARDEMREKWHRIKIGEMEREWWKETTEGEELMEAAEYD